ncbi:hypothetical protein [Paenibacillus sp. Z6-24]
MSHELLTDVQHHEGYREAQFFSLLFQRNVSVHLMDTETPLEINRPEDILPLIQPLALSIPSISAEETVQTDR